MNYKEIQIKKAKWWQEIKSLEQEYKRGLSLQKKLQYSLSDISASIQIKINKINKESEKYDSYCFENNEGEFTENDKDVKILKEKKVVINKPQECWKCRNVKDKKTEMIFNTIIDFDGTICNTYACINCA